jgi:hypothetical protein
VNAASYLESKGGDEKDMQKCPGSYVNLQGKWAGPTQFEEPETLDSAIMPLQMRVVKVRSQLSHFQKKHDSLRQDISFHNAMYFQV